MQVTKVTRSYSKSINTRTYGAPESWIKLECIYQAEIESNDDATKISAMIYEQAKKEVIDDANAIILQIRNSIAPVAPAPVFAPAPVATPPVAPPAPVYAAPVMQPMPVSGGMPVRL